MRLKTVDFRRISAIALREERGVPLHPLADDPGRADAACNRFHVVTQRMAAGY